MEHLVSSKRLLALNTILSFPYNVSIRMQPAGLPEIHISNNLQLSIDFPYWSLNKIETSSSFPISVSIASLASYLLTICPSVILRLIKYIH